MSYALSFTEAPEESVERVRREQLEAAVESLAERGDVHDARKRLKKTRALARLVRPALKPNAFRARNRELRDTGRSLSGARDAEVMVETVEDLAERYAGRAPYEPVRAVLERRRTTDEPGDAT